ncbi:MAG TPA: glycine cleavage system protein GcvH [Gammaproteobacteria bacterium]|nr:glycine cleavage system protein GcvH [Gammaproteobacteria bacterium]
MSKVPKELKYTQTHEWVLVEDDGTILVGITEHAQSQLGELVLVELPDLNAKVSASDEVGVIESVKATSEFYSPISGKIIEINENLEESPALVNTDPYGDGWLFRIDPIDPDELSDLLDAEAYSQYMEEDED